MVILRVDMGVRRSMPHTRMCLCGMIGMIHLQRHIHMHAYIRTTGLPRSAGSPRPSPSCSRPAPRRAPAGRRCSSSGCRSLVRRLNCVNVFVRVQSTDRPIHPSVHPSTHTQMTPNLHPPQKKHNKNHAFGRAVARGERAQGGGEVREEQGQRNLPCLLAAVVMVLVGLVGVGGSSFNRS